jgi:hypothetical protein
MKRYALYHNEPQGQVEFITSSYVQAMMKASKKAIHNNAKLANNQLPADSIVAVSAKYVVVRYDDKRKARR